MSGGVDFGVTVLESLIQVCEEKTDCTGGEPQILWNVFSSVKDVLYFHGVLNVAVINGAHIHW